MPLTFTVTGILVIIGGVTKTLMQDSFFPLFLILYVFQFFLLPLAMSTSFLATFFFNLLYAAAVSYYFHITFLGFNGKKGTMRFCGHF